MPQQNKSGKCGYCKRAHGAGHTPKCPHSAGTGETRKPDSAPTAARAVKASVPPRNGWDAKLDAAKARVMELRAELAREELRVEILAEMAEGR